MTPSSSAANFSLSKLTAIFSPGTNSNGKKDKTVVTTDGKSGRICLTCDRKYILYNFYSDFACQVEEFDGMIKEEKEVLNDVNTRFRAVKTELVAVKRELEEQSK